MLMKRGKQINITRPDVQHSSGHSVLNTISDIALMKRMSELSRMNQIIEQSHLVSEKRAGGKLSREYFIARIRVLEDRLAQPQFAGWI